MIFYHVISDKPKFAGQRFKVDEDHPNGVAEIYWRNGPNEDGRDPIVEVLVDGEIEVVEIMKEINANV